LKNQVFFLARIISQGQFQKVPDEDESLILLVWSGIKLLARYTKGCYNNLHLLPYCWL